MGNNGQQFTVLHASLMPFYLYCIKGALFSIWAQTCVWDTGSLKTWNLKMSKFKDLESLINTYVWCHLVIWHFAPELMSSSGCQSWKGIARRRDIFNCGQNCTTLFTTKTNWCAPPRLRHSTWIHGKLSLALPVSMLQNTRPPSTGSYFNPQARFWGVLDLNWPHLNTPQNMRFQVNFGEDDPFKYFWHPRLRFKTTIVDWLFPNVSPWFSN